MKKPVGGAKQMHRLAECILSTGREAFIIQDDANFHPSWFSSNVKAIAFEEWRTRSDLRPDQDIIILPDTVFSSFSSYLPGHPTVVFNQNISYTFGAMKLSHNPYSVLSRYSSDSLSHVLCVSRHDLHVLTDGFGLDPNRVSLLVNALEHGMFLPAKRKKRQIAFMPRKNMHDSNVVCAMLSQQSWFKGWKFAPIHHSTHHEVSRILGESLIFLSFGHPEGFGLPVAEAFASGCVVIGYSGLGGRELFSLAEPFNISTEVAFGDWLGFVDSVKGIAERVESSPKTLVIALRQCSDLFNQTYNFEAMRLSVVKALEAIESRLHSESPRTNVSQPTC